MAEQLVSLVPVTILDGLIVIVKFIMLQIAIQHIIKAATFKMSFFDFPVVFIALFLIVNDVHGFMSILILFYQTTFLFQ